MYKAVSSVRVRYAETDQMGIVYYGVYPQYFEIGRVEALRELGISYRDMELAGTMLPVTQLQINYHKAAKYDDLLTVHSTIKTLEGARIEFAHEVRNAAGDLLTTGSVSLVFVDQKTMRPKRPPKELIDILQPYFDHL
jgi:acyl-CoA thioester hydrolase